MAEEDKKITFDDFKEFHERHPDMDNSDYYAEFPDVNKGTLRSWKAKAGKPIKKIIKVAPQEEPEQDGNTWDEEMFKALCTQTNTPMSEFEGVDPKSAQIILRNKLVKQGSKKTTSNGSILPNPPPIGQNKKSFPIDPYIVFDDIKNEIRMEIPMDTLMDPDKNAALRGETYKHGV